MTGTPRWVPDAIQDLQNGHDWYDEREPDLGQQLAAEVFTVLDRAVRNPLLPRKYEHADLTGEPEVRKIHLQRFDEYGIVYTIVNEIFWVLAVAHAKRKPGY